MVFKSKWQRNFGLVFYYDKNKNKYMRASLKLIYDPTLPLPMNLLVDVYEDNSLYLYGIEQSCIELEFQVENIPTEFFGNQILYYHNICGERFKLTFEQGQILVGILDILIEESKE